MTTADRTGTVAVSVGQFELSLPAWLVGGDDGRRVQPAADGVATLRLQHARAGVLSITVEPEGGDGASPLLERLDRISADMTARGVDLERVRARQREAASMVGPEVALRVQQGGASHGLALWIGSPREAAAPASRVVAQLVVQGDGLEPGLDLWDHVLDSISPGGTP